MILGGSRCMRPGEPGRGPAAGADRLVAGGARSHRRDGTGGEPGEGESMRGRPVMMTAAAVLSAAVLAGASAATGAGAATGSGTRAAAAVAQGGTWGTAAEIPGSNRLN